MAKKSISYPTVSEQSWWRLRNFFKQKVPSAVTPTYLASVLSITTNSANTNIISPFKIIGIIDKTGKPTELAYDWRDDSKYKGVCKKLVESLYPQELRDLFSSPESVDFKKLTNWFMSSVHCGISAGQKYASFYNLLLSASLNGAETEKSKSIKNTSTAATNRKGSNVVNKIGTNKKTPQKQIKKPLVDSPERKQPSSCCLPELHINIQLHISPESTAEQIDKIFESMAKHLKEFNI
jgi:hypothetical protein